MVFKDPVAYDERVDLADTCSTQLGIEFPALVDKLDNSTESAYTAWPDRIYVIDVDGRIIFKSDAGPFGFKAQQLSEILGKHFPSDLSSTSMRRP